MLHQVFALVLLFVSSAYCATGVLYGLSGPTVGLVSIDPRTAYQRPIGTTINTELEAQQLSSIDAANNLIYIVGLNTTTAGVNLIGVDLTTGRQRYQIALPFASSAFVGVGQIVEVDTNSGEVYVAGRDPQKGNQHHVVSVNPKSGAITSIVVIADGDVLGGISGFDPKNQVLWIEYATNNGQAISLVRVDLKTRTYATYPNPINLETMDFDPVQGVFVGIGLQVDSPTSYYRVFLTLDSTTNQFRVVSKIPGYFIIRAAEGALDYVGRKYYSILQPVGKSTAPFQLVEYDMKSNTVMNHPLIGGNSCNTCPWSLHFKSN